MRVLRRGGLSDRRHLAAGAPSFPAQLHLCVALCELLLLLQVLGESVLPLAACAQLNFCCGFFLAVGFLVDACLLRMRCAQTEFLGASLLYQDDKDVQDPAFGYLSYVSKVELGSQVCAQPGLLPSHSASWRLL